MTMTLGQEKINLLVDVFYSKLTKESYYSKMFEERGVDIELLKERQRSFISRLANESDEDGKTNQVKERHPFHTTPERAAIWMGTMEEAMNEIELDKDVKKNLLEKIGSLLNNIIK